MKKVFIVKIGEGEYDNYIEIVIAVLVGQAKQSLNAFEQEYINWKNSVLQTHKAKYDARENY